MTINGAAPSADAPPLLSAEDAAKPTLILSGAKLPTGVIVLQVQGCIGTDCDTLTLALALALTLALTLTLTLALATVSLSVTPNPNPNPNPNRQPRLPQSSARCLSE